MTLDSDGACERVKVLWITDHNCNKFSQCDGYQEKYKSADDDRMQADDNMNRVRPEAEAWRPIHRRYGQNTPSTEMISGSLLHYRADEHNQLLDEFVVSMESKEQKQMEDLAGTQAHHHEQQLRKELSMVAQDNDAKHGDVNSRQEAYQEDRPQYYVFDRGSTWKQKVYQLGKCMYDLLQLIRLCPLRDTEHSMSMKGHTFEQNMTTVEKGYTTADDEGPVHIRESSGYEEQHSRSCHETSWRIAYTSTREEIGITLSG